MNKTMCVKGAICALSIAAVASLEATTPLHQAVAEGDTAAVQQLLQEAKSNVNAVDPKGETPLQLAIANGNVKAVKILLCAGANANAADHNGVTPLQLATEKGLNDVVEVLQAHGAQ